MTCKQVRNHQKDRESLELHIAAGIPTHSPISSLFLLIQCDRDFRQLHMQRVSKLYHQLKSCHGECRTQHIKPQLFCDTLIKRRASASRKQTNAFADSLLI